jgi:putative phosphoserine phosphatase/1-acylglycerol-3-phosphate O-acyltransferase
VWNVLRPPLVTVRVGAPVQLAYEDENADIETIMSAIAALLPPESRARHTPTDEELRLASPPS